MALHVDRSHVVLLLTYFFNLFSCTIFLFLRGGSLGKMLDPVRSVIPECKGLNSPDPVRKAGGGGGDLT